MKKLIIVCLGLLTFGLGVTIAHPSETSINGEISMSSTREIPVYVLTNLGGGVYGQTQYTGIYNPDYGDYGEITIKGQPYTVRLNPAYGQDKDYRADFRYYAGGYYFNL
jgi:hypothetical protein